MSAIIERDVTSGTRVPDFGDALALADVKKTPMLTMLPKGTAPHHTSPQWGVESYPAPTITGAVDEQPVTDYDTSQNVAALITGRVMIQQHAIRVSRFADKVMDQVGVGYRKAYAKALARAMIILARKVETRILSDDDSYEGSANPNDGPETRGLISWASATAQSDLPVNSDFRPPAAQNSTTTIANFTDSTIADVVESMFNSTGDAAMDLMLAHGSKLGGKLARLTSWSKDESGFTYIRRFNDSDGETYSQVVNVIQTQYGRVILRPSSFINSSGDPTSAQSRRNGLLFPLVKEAIRLRFSWGLENEDLPNDGGGRRALCSTAYCLEVGNPLWIARFIPSA
jgi:hypothetical protein